VLIACLKVIKIPIPAGASVDNGSREFGFSLSAINGNPNGSYQCIRQSMRDRLSRYVRCSAISINYFNLFI